MIDCGWGIGQMGQNQSGYGWDIDYDLFDGLNIEWLVEMM